MITRWDIEQAIRRSRSICWDQPKDIEKRIAEQKARSFLGAAGILLDSMEKSGEDYSVPVIQESYYSMLTWATRLLFEDGKKLPQGTPDSHYTVFCAILYFFFINGSGLEKKKGIMWEDISENRLSKSMIETFAVVQTDAEELQAVSVRCSKKQWKTCMMKEMHAQDLHII